MKKFNDRLDHSRMDRRRRQRIVDVGGVGPMTPDRVKCPFCSELILRDAIKCRFCGEWFSMPDEDVGAGDAIGEDHYAVSDQERNHLAVVDIQKPIVPAEAVQEVDNEVRQAHEGGGGEYGRRADDIETSPPRVAREVIPSEGLAASVVVRKERRRIPWLRALLLILYLGAAGAMFVFESEAREILNFAGNVKAEDPNGAINKYSMYSEVLNDFPFSFAVVEARQELLEICQSAEFEMPESSWFLRVKGLFGEHVAPQGAYLLPFVAWPVSVLSLLLVFLTRISRPGVAVLALLLLIGAVAGSVGQLAWYGLIPLTPATDVAGPLMQRPATVYCASYLLLVVTAFMTLTARGKRQSRHMAKMATARAKRR
ncbi:MAG: hypothetical protein ACYTE3_25195 [Planctomycetota bacterium]|jgi:hypothetical protein